MSSQGHKHGSGVHKHGSQGDDDNDHFDIRSILLEETFHWVHHWAWSKVYPPFNYTWDSLLGKCTKQAQCIWWKHPENAACSDMNGNRCPDGDDAAPCTGSCAEYLVPGRCNDNEDVEPNCAYDSCDIVEFFHKMYLTWIGDVLASPPWDWMSSAPDRSLEELLTSTSDCSALLDAMKDNAQYFLPKKKYTGIYKSPKVVNTCSDLPPSAHAAAASAVRALGGAVSTLVAVAQASHCV